MMMITAAGAVALNVLRVMLFDFISGVCWEMASCCSCFMCVSHRVHSRAGRCTAEFRCAAGCLHHLLQRLYITVIFHY